MLPFSFSSLLEPTKSLVFGQQVQSWSNIGSTHNMTLSLVNEPKESIPVRMNSDNVILIGETRVTLDTVVDAFVSGATPEEIVYQYPSLDLADVYAVLGYYLHHRTEVDNYLKQRQIQAQQVREANEKSFSPAGIRERLIARQHQRI